MLPVNTARVGSVLVIVGLITLFIPNTLLPRVYNAVVNVVSNITITLSNYSRYLIPIYLDKPSYVIVMLSNSHPLPVYMLDALGHVFTPSGYRYVHGFYLVTFPLVGHGNYSLVLINDYPEVTNVSLAVTVISQYVINNALAMDVVMDVGTAILILGALLIAAKYLRKIA